MLLSASVLFGGARCRRLHTLRSTLLIPSQIHNLQQGNKSKSPDDNQATSSSSSSSASKSIGCQILENNGFIAGGSLSGSSSYLPAGKRVLNKLVELVREEMNAAGGQEIELPALADLAVWQKTGRDALMGNELFTLSDRQGRAMCLCPTHEELVTGLVARYAKQLPAACLGASRALLLYQITRKYRDESRPKHGLLRNREFLMKVNNDKSFYHTVVPQG